MTNPEQFEEWRRQARDPDPSVRWNLTSREPPQKRSSPCSPRTMTSWLRRVLDELSVREGLHEIAATNPNARPELNDRAPIGSFSRNSIDRYLEQRNASLAGRPEQSWRDAAEIPRRPSEKLSYGRDNISSPVISTASRHHCPENQLHSRQTSHLRMSP